MRHGCLVRVVLRQQGVQGKGKGTEEDAEVAATLLYGVGDCAPLPGVFRGVVGCCVVCFEVCV